MDMDMTSKTQFQQLLYMVGVYKDRLAAGLPYNLQHFMQACDRDRA